MGRVQGRWKMGVFSLHKMRDRDRGRGERRERLFVWRLQLTDTVQHSVTRGGGWRERKRAKFAKSFTPGAEDREGWRGRKAEDRD